MSFNTENKEHSLALITFFKHIYHSNVHIFYPFWPLNLIPNDCLVKGKDNYFSNIYCQHILGNFSN